MSDFVARDILSEIINSHWNYLDTEESIQKLEERKKLEGLLKEYLCVVQHDKKFFVPETAIVLKNSIRELHDFNVQRAITAFESISQYANNLFTKPWRKEFRVIKMYSGFYQHEIASNLLDAEKLFEAMGYRSLSDDTLVLDGCICPDQVSNVSRDAMSAYVELQIIRHIYTGLDAIGISCPLLDIYRYREKHTGGTSQAIEELANAIEEKRYRYREKALATDNYGYIDVQPSGNYSPSSAQFPSAQAQCASNQCACNDYRQQVPPAPPPMHRHLRPTGPSNGMCCGHDQKQQRQQQHQQHIHPIHPTGNLMDSNMTYPTAQQNYHHQQHYPTVPAETGAGHLPHMSHSRSLEQYSEPVNQHHHNMLPHRHSFDHQQQQQQQGCAVPHQQHLHQHNLQQQNYYHHINQPSQNFYESSYDFIDGNSLAGDSSSISYAAAVANGISGNVATAPVNCNINSNSTYSHPYNVSGNRFPLPFNISSQLATYDNMNSYRSEATHEPTYDYIPDNHMYASVTKLPQNGKVGYNLAAAGDHNQPAPGPLQNSSKDVLQRQAAEPLIYFEDHPILPPPPSQQHQHHQQQQQQFDNIYQTQYQQPNHINMMAALPHPGYASWQPNYGTTKSPALNDNSIHAYAKPIPRENPKPIHNSMDKNYITKTSSTSAERGGDTTDLSYESANDDLITQQNERQHHQRSPTQFTKNQEGVGTFRSWDYVYQNLDVSGYSKDLGDRGDLLVESLDLDSLNINNDTSTSQTSSAEKRRSNYAGTEEIIAATTAQQTPQQHQPQAPAQTQNKRKTRTFDRSTSSSKNTSKMELEASASSSAVLAKNINGKQKASNDNNKKMKSALKQTNATSKMTSNKNSTTLNKNPAKASDNKSPPKTVNNNNNTNSNSNSNSLINTDNVSQATQRKKSSSSTGQNPNKYSGTTNPPITTQIIVTSPNEWSCRFCTFLNPNTKRICEMCYKTIDFDANTAASAAANNPSPAAAGSSSVAHNTPTCV